MVSMAARAAAHATGLPPYVPPSPPAWTESITSARPVTAASGSPPAIPLAVVTRSGTTPSWSLANQSPVRAKPVWISSAMKRMPCSRHHAATRASQPGGGTMKPPSPWIGSMRTAAQLSSPTWAWTVFDEGVEGLVGARLGAARPAVGVGHRGAVDLAGEGPEAVLVGHVLRGQRHREVRPPVVGVVEHDDGVAAGVVARHLHRVLHRLGPGVEERRALLVVAGGELGELLADLDVLLVGRDHEAGVGEVGDLALHRLDHPRRGVADGGHRDARAEVDELVAVDVAEDAAARLLDVHRQRGADAGGDARDLAGLQRLRARAGDLGGEDAFLGERHDRSSIPHGDPYPSGFGAASRSRKGFGGSASGPSTPAPDQVPLASSSRATTGLIAVCHTTHWAP